MELPSSNLPLRAAQWVKEPDATLEERETVQAARVQVEEKQAAQRRALAEQHVARQQQQEAERSSQAERALVEERRQAEAAERQAQDEKLAYLAPFVADSLKKAAREGRTTTWQRSGRDRPATGAMSAGGPHARRSNDPHTPPVSVQPGPTSGARAASAISTSARVFTAVTGPPRARRSFTGQP